MLNRIIDTIYILYAYFTYFPDPCKLQWPPCLHVSPLHLYLVGVYRDHNLQQVVYWSCQFLHIFSNNWPFSSFFTITNICFNITKLSKAEEASMTFQKSLHYCNNMNTVVGDRSVTWVDLGQNKAQTMAPVNSPNPFQRGVTNNQGPGLLTPFAISSPPEQF